MKKYIINILPLIFCLSFLSFKNKLDYHKITYEKSEQPILTVEKNDELNSKKNLSDTTSLIISTLSKNNELYVNQDNQINISVFGVDPRDIMVSVTGAGVSITNLGQGNYNIKATRKGKCDLKVSSNINGIKKSIGEKHFLIK